MGRLGLTERVRMFAPQQPAPGIVHSSGATDILALFRCLGQRPGFPPNSQRATASREPPHSDRYHHHPRRLKA